MHVLLWLGDHQTSLYSADGDHTLGFSAYCGIALELVLSDKVGYDYPNYCSLTGHYL